MYQRSLHFGLQDNCWKVIAGVETKMEKKRCRLSGKNAPSLESGAHEGQGGWVSGSLEAYISAAAFQSGSKADPGMWGE
jgi:hypothetical protein